MRKLLLAMSNALSMIKGFDTGHTSRIDDRLMLDYEGKRYIVKFIEIENPDEDMFKDIDHYLR